MVTKYRGKKPYKVVKASLALPNADARGWDGRFIVPAGAYTECDCGGESSLGYIYNTKATSRGLEFECWFDPDATCAEQRAALQAGHFLLKPFIYGEGSGPPSHMEITFNTGGVTPMANNQLFVNPQKCNPEPLVVERLEEVFKKKLERERLTQRPKADIIDDDDEGLTVPNFWEYKKGGGRGA